MTTIFLFLSLIAAPKASNCVEARLLDGRTVTMCDGRVTSVRDDFGNVRTAEGK